MSKTKAASFGAIAGIILGVFAAEWFWKGGDGNPAAYYAVVSISAILLAAVGQLFVRKDP